MRSADPSIQGLPSLDRLTKSPTSYSHVVEQRCEADIRVKQWSAEENSQISYHIGKLRLDQCMKTVGY